MTAPKRQPFGHEALDPPRQWGFVDLEPKPWPNPRLALSSNCASPQRRKHSWLQLLIGDRVTLKLANITFDCADTIRVASFWSEALGLTFKEGASDFFVALDGGSVGPTWFFIKVPEGKTAKNRMHIDLTADAATAEVARLVALGAVHIANKDEWGIQWSVLNDPEGNEFCVSGSHA